MSTCLQCMHDISMAGLLHPLNTSYVGEKSKPPLTCEQRIGYLVPKGMNHSYLLCSLTEKSWSYVNDCIVTVTYSVHKHVCPKYFFINKISEYSLVLTENLKMQRWVNKGKKRVKPLHRNSVTSCWIRYNYL